MEGRDDFAAIAEENVKLAGLEKIITIKLKDVCQGIDERDVDLVTLDIPQPEDALSHAEAALKVGGHIASFVPCVEQLQELYREIRNFRFRDLKTIECLVREMRVAPECTRPNNRMISHTGYLTFARRA